VQFSRGAFALVNFQAEHAVNDDTTMTVGAINLLDEIYSLAEGFPSQGVNSLLISRLVSKWNGANMKISARNVLKGKIVEVVKGTTTAHVRIDVNGTIVTASITNEAVDELALKKGMTASAVIKSSDVMVAVD